MGATAPINLLLTAGGLGILTIAFALSTRLTNKKIAFNSSIQSFRWVLVGIIISVTFEIYQAANILGLQMFFLFFAVSGLLMIETALTQFEKDINENENTIKKGREAAHEDEDPIQEDGEEVDETEGEVEETLANSNKN